MTQNNKQAPPDTGSTDQHQTGREVLMGYIASAHGIRGEVLVKSFSDEPTSLADYTPIIARHEKGGESLRVEITHCRETGKGLITRIKGVGDRTRAEKLKGFQLWVPRSALPETDEGEFYYDDLIGLITVDGSGTPFGTIKSVENYGAGDLLEIDLNDGGSELVPFTHAHVPNVLIKEGKVVVNWPLSYIVASDADRHAEDDITSED